MAASLLLLGSAARTADSASASSDNFIGISTGTYALAVLIDMTASGGAISLTPAIQFQEPSGGNWVDVWEGVGPITALDDYYYFFQFGTGVTPTIVLGEAVTIALNGALWRFQMKHGNANSQTYSVGAYWISVL